MYLDGDGRPYLPASRPKVHELLKDLYGYTSLGWPDCAADGHAGECHGLPDVFPLTAESETGAPFAPPLPDGYGPADWRSSWTALVALLAIGSCVRVLVYLSLVLTDRARRR